MHIQHTPAPFPSTILSLTPQEQFSYRSTTIHAVTISPASTPDQAPYLLSGQSRSLRTLRKLRTFPVQILPPGIPPLVSSTAQAELAACRTLQQAQAHPDARAVLRAATPPPAPAPPALRAGKHRA